MSLFFVLGCLLIIFSLVFGLVGVGIAWVGPILIFGFLLVIIGMVGVLVIFERQSRRLVLSHKSNGWMETITEIVSGLLLIIR